MVTLSGSDIQLAVPPVSWEERVWVPSSGNMFLRSELRLQTGPYKSALVPSLRDLAPSLTPEIVTDLEDATRALTAFDQYVSSRLGPGHSATAPMSAILLRTESASSSQIEKLTASARSLALAELQEGSSSNAALVVGNIRAMEAALRLSDHLSVTTILDMHQALLASDRDLASHAGRLRNELVWVGNGDAGPLRADFVPPQAEYVAESVNDLVAFMERDDLPVLLQAAVAHAQFLTIHPFMGGNGRTGRALSQSLLRNKGVSTQVSVPFSAGLLRDTSRYFAALQSFRLGNAEPIVRTFTAAVRYAAATGSTLIDQLASELALSSEKLRGVRSQSAAFKVLPLLIGQPVINVDYLVRTAGFNKMTATRAIDLLVERKVLTEVTGNRRNRVWQHTGVLGILDEYAAQIRRPRPNH